MNVTRTIVIAVAAAWAQPATTQRLTVSTATPVGVFAEANMQGDVSGATLLHTFSGFTVNGQFLTVTLPTPTAARHFQVRTTSSASWVAWSEVQVFGVVPEPSSMGVVLLGCFGLGCFRRFR